MSWSIFDVLLDIFDVFIKLAIGFLPVHQALGLSGMMRPFFVQSLGAAVFLLSWFIDLRLFFVGLGIHITLWTVIVGILGRRAVRNLVHG